MNEPSMVEIPLPTLQEVLSLLHDGLLPKVPYGDNESMLKAAYEARGGALSGASGRLRCFLPAEVTHR